MISQVDLTQLSEVAKMILDFLLNVPATRGHEGVVETLELSASEGRGTVQSEWDALIEQDVIVKSDYYFLVNPSLVASIKLALEQHLRQKGISQEIVANYLQSQVQQNQGKLTIFANLMSKAYTSDNVELIVFSDYEWSSELLSLCDELTKQGIVFRVSSSTRKHYYRSYYLRNWPFDSGQVLRDTILRYLNVEGLTGEEWKVLLLLLLGRDLQLRYEVLARNMELTDPQLRELVTNLKDRGLLSESAGYVSVLKALANPLAEYFKTNVYPAFKDNVVEHLKRIIARSLSTLWLFTGAKRINELGIGETRLAPLPLKLVDKGRIPQFEPQFQDMTRLNLIFDLDDKILILSDIVKDVENWLRSSIHESIIFIPAKDFYLARRVLQDMFSKCETYVKIQDAYLGEETFDILEYIPQQVKIQLLGGIRLGAGEDPNKVCQRIERFKSDRKDSFEIFFVGKHTGATPFHDRFVISKNHCWTTGTSLKQIGREKDTAITEFSKDKGGEQIELAFDSLWFADSEDLQHRGYVKLDLEGWKTQMMPQE